MSGRARRAGDEEWQSAEERDYDAFTAAFPARNNNGSGTAGVGGSFKLTRFNAILMDTSAAYLVNRLIPSGGLTLAWGPPKCGKSFFIFYVTMHIARGIPYRGRRVKQGTSSISRLRAAASSPSGVEAYKREHGVTDAPFHLVTESTDLIRDHKELIACIEEQAGADRPAVVVIDTLNRSLVGSAATKTWRRTSRPPTRSATRSIAR